MFSMNNEQIIKALEGYSGAFYAKIVWGVDFAVLSEKDKRNYTQKIHTRRNKPSTFLPHEINQIKTFLKSKTEDFEAVLICI